MDELLGVDLRHQFSLEADQHEEGVIVAEEILTDKHEDGIINDHLLMTSPPSRRLIFFFSI